MTANYTRAPVVEFIVHGTPEPGGSKKAVPQGNRYGVVDANPRVGGWKNRVAQVAAERYDGEFLIGALSVNFTFYVPRPKGHWGTGRNAGRLKDSAPVYPTTRPDALKLARAVEDALSGVIYRDDSQIVIETLRKAYGKAGVQVQIWVLEEAAVPLAEAA